MPTVPPASPRLLTLDAMRGLAAFAVVLFHLPDVGLAASGYLAVDFFFLLSGFVIARTYDARLRAGLPFRRFAVLRAIRLYPLFLLGLGIGLLRCLGQIVLDRPDRLDPGLLALAAPFELLMLPSPVTEHLFALNGPSWSLFFEMAISLLYGAALVRARLRWLIATVAVCGALLAWITVSRGSLEVGWAWAHLHGGFARVGFAFTLGMVLARVHRAPARGSWWCVLPMLALVAALSLRPAPGWRVAYDLGVAMLAAPLLVWLGASWNPAPALAHASRVLGELSYPVYAIHYPALWMFGFVARKAGVPALVWMPAFVVLIAAAAWLALVRFDQPVRARLGRLAARGGRSVQMPST